MSLTTEERHIVVEYEFAKARLNMEQAKANIQFEYWDLVSNRLYYALFHAVSALLIYDGFPVSSHKGAVLMFGKHYVCVGKMTRDDGRLYSQLQTMREKGDYNCIYSASAEEILPLVERVEALIEKIRGLLPTDTY